MLEPWARRWPLPGFIWPFAGGFAVAGAIAGLGWIWLKGSRVPKLIAATTYMAVGMIPGFHAWLNVLRSERNPSWEPTSRGGLKPC